MGKKEDLSDFERGMVGARRTDLSISKTADLLWFSHTTLSRVYREWSEKEKISSERQLCGQKCLVDVRDQRRMGRLVRDDRKTTVTQINTRYNQGMQNNNNNNNFLHLYSAFLDTQSALHSKGAISSSTTNVQHPPGWVPLLSDKNRTRRLQFTQAQQNWTIEDWKNIALSDESWFLLQHSDGRVRIWHKEHESMDPSCLVSMVQAGGGGMMQGIISWHTLGPLCTNWASFKPYSLPEYCCWPCRLFMTTVHPSSDDYFQQDNASCHKAQIISDWFLEHDNEFTLLKWPPQSPDLDPITFGMWIHLDFNIFCFHFNFS